MQTYCTDFISSTRVTVYAECICVFLTSLNTMLIVDKHCSDVCCDKLPVPQIDRKSKQVKKPVTWKILFAISMGENSLF